MKRACVIGWPVAHTLSPVIHGYWLGHYDVKGEYFASAVDREGFPAFCRTLAERGLAGGNVTLPHKLTAFELCDHRDEAAAAIGAVNTLWLENGSLCGSNTDAGGFLANLDAVASGWDFGSFKRSAVIGAGGAARAIVWALRQRGFEDIRIVNRTQERAENLALDFRPARAGGFDSMTTALKGATLVVNTSSLGMQGQDPLDLDLSDVADGATVCDIVYTPLETDLLAAARSRKLTCVDGLGMLLHQAAPGFQRWFGVTPEVTPALRAAVLAEIAARQQSQ